MDEEIKEEKLDSPLIVHKISDASYQETANEANMAMTHIDDDSSDGPTLERHRFKKEKKKSKAPFIILALVVIAAVIIGVLVNNGTFSGKKEETSASKKTYATQPVNTFEGIITVKSTYIFFEGEEVNGIGELERKIKYLDKGTKFTVQDEHADSNFLNFEVLSLLSEYEMDYEITHIASSGLISQFETTVPTSNETPSQAQPSSAAQPVSE